MKTERNILVAFILNLAFSVFEFFGGIVTGSVAIVSDAVHDLGDAAGIGISYFLEKKSKKSRCQTPGFTGSSQQQKNKHNTQKTKYTKQVYISPPKAQTLLPQKQTQTVGMISVMILVIQKETAPEIGSGFLSTQLV